MKKEGISQETLKLIACITMLIDHTAAVFGMGVGPYYAMRAIGRIAFPIFCFLLAEGAHYTRNPKKYALRLGIGMLLSELPFDYALFGGLNWNYQSVMVTMLLGFLAIEAMKRPRLIVWKLLILVPFFFAAELLRTDYGGWGVVMIVMFYLTRELPHRTLWQTGLLFLICWLIGGLMIAIGPVSIPMECVGVLAMVPICFYQGKKVSFAPGVQWGFYLFYPVHLAILFLIQTAI